MILSYLILSHLLGDFVFQPSKLVLWKMRSFWGVLVHVLVHIVVMLIVLSPFIIAGNYWILLVIAIINFVHLLIDQAKISYDLKHDTKVIPFLVDQFFHFFTIFTTNFILDANKIKLSFPKNEFFTVYTDLKLVVFLSVMVFVSMVIEIFRFQKELEKDKTRRIKFRKKKMFDRMMFFGVMYFVVTLYLFYS